MALTGLGSPLNIISLLRSASKELKDVVVKQSGVLHPITALRACTVAGGSLGLLCPSAMLTVSMAEPHLPLLHELPSSGKGTGKVSAAERKQVLIEE